MGIVQLIRKGNKAIKESVKRFPIAVFLSTIVVIILIYMNETHLWYWDDGFKRCAMVLALGIPLYLSIQLLLERQNKEHDKLTYIYYGVGVVFLTLYGVFFLKAQGMVEITRYIGFMLIFILLFLVIPYIKKSGNFEIYIIKILGRFFITVLYSMVIYLGIVAILLTIDYLLEINVRLELYYYTFLTIGGIFAPCYFLGGIPEKNEKLNPVEYPRVLRVLMLYIIMPLLTIYTMILYIYFGKIIITMTWPQGLVSHLVLWYGIISVGTLFLIDILSKDNLWVKNYIKIFPKAILPLMVMMFISMGIRINAYGITENRYFVLALGIWITGIMIYYGFSKKRINTILPITIAIVIAIAICGPLSSYSLSKFSQNRRFEKIMEKNHMIVNGEIVKAQGDISKEDQEEISSILHYFKNNHSLNEIKSIPENFKIEDMEKTFGISDLNIYDYNNNEYFYYGIEGVTEPISIEDYNYFFEINSYSITDIKSKDGINLKLDKEQNRFIINRNGEEIYSKDINEYAENMIKEFGVDSEKMISIDRMKYEDETNNVKIQFIFKSIAGSRDTNSQVINIEELQFYVLVKIK